MRKSLIVFLLIIFFSGFGKIDLSLQNEIEFSLKRALNWLVNEQEEDGSWMHYPAITGLSVLSILRSNEGLTADFEPVAKGLSFILDCVQLDGSIHAGELPNYNTAICLLAFKEADDGRFADIIDGAEKYLLRIQLDEEEGFTPDSLYYGGIGYDGSDNRPDLSNLNWVMEALVERQTLEIEKSDKPEAKNQTAKKLFYDKALLFLRRCQNLQEYNPMDYAEDDGGFIYEVGKSKAGGVNSYGSMTYIGLKSMIYAELGQTDRG